MCKYTVGGLSRKLVAWWGKEPRLGALEHSNNELLVDALSGMQSQLCIKARHGGHRP